MSREIGQRFEQMAQNFLCQQGLVFIEKNVYVGRKELDLIMLDEREEATLVFVEVRYRHYSLEAAFESISPQKQRNLMLAAEHYLHIHHWHDILARFDVVVISGPVPYRIEWAQMRLSNSQ